MEMFRSERNSRILGPGEKALNIMGMSASKGESGQRNFHLGRDQGRQGCEALAGELLQSVCKEQYQRPVVHR